MANFKAIKEIFPKTNINGCFFHLTQNLWKHVQEEKKVKELNKVGNLYNLFRSLQYLAFVPISDVKRVYIHIKQKYTKYVKTLKYFEKYYAGKITRANRKPPVFAIEMWNCHERVLGGSPRTNYSVEAWHKPFELCCGKKPGLLKLIQNFREEQKLSELEIERLKAGKFISKITNKELMFYFLCKN